MKYEQISFIKSIEETISKPETYDATICNKCCCDKCVYSSGLYPPLTKQEKENMEVDDFCYKCDKFKKANYYVEQEKHYIELEAERRRRNLRII